jgi:hypothetical protein
MIFLSYLPIFVRVIFEGMPGIWKSHHRLVFCWFVYMQALTPNKKTITELSRWSPARITEWRLRRLLYATYLNIDLLIAWFAQEAIKCFPPPDDKIVYVVGDGSHKDKRGKKNPVAQKGTKGKGKPFFWGIRFVLVALCWDVFRIPVAFRIILPKNHPEYKNENTLFREMLMDITLPEWAETAIVLGDCGYGSKDNMKLIQKMGKERHKNRRWFFVFSIARTWKRESGKSIKDFVKHLPRCFYNRTWLPQLTQNRRRKTFWVYGKVMNLNHIGEVTVVLSKKWRNVGPKNTKIIVTNIPNVSARQVISIYQRRWPIEIIFKELKSALGLGEHQVSKEEKRIRNSIGIAIISYLFLLIACKEHINRGQSWGIFNLQEKFRIKVMTNQIRHSMNLKIEKLQRAA